MKKENQSQCGDSAFWGGGGNIYHVHKFHARAYYYSAPMRLQMRGDHTKIKWDVELKEKEEKRGEEVPCEKVVRVVVLLLITKEGGRECLR